MDEGTSYPILAASVYDVRYFTALLKGVNFANRATVTITKIGLTVTVEEARTLLGTTFIFANLFDEYTYRQAAFDESTDELQNAGSENVAFEIPLTTLIECLGIFGSAGMSSSSGGSHRKWKAVDEESELGDRDEDNNIPKEQKRVGSWPRRGIESYFGSGPEKKTSMRLLYAGAGSPLTLLLAEDATGPTTTCEITTFEPEPILDLEFDNSKLLLKIILKSSWLRDALTEIDPSCERITLISNPSDETAPLRVEPKKRIITEKSILRIQAEGAFGSIQMDYPNDKDVLETFECMGSLEFSYRFNYIARTLRALQSSTKTSLRIDEDGLLSLQFLMPSSRMREDDSPGFIEFKCLALDEELLT
ncbi:hypothetical protein AX17_001902 [Amanita inopinata Kibby_2008]|nr:hypothetical protein AX17_001902 [Amanita inopinata Kibby_2008]